MVILYIIPEKVKKLN